MGRKRDRRRGQPGNAGQYAPDTRGKDGVTDMSAVPRSPQRIADETGDPEALQRAATAYTAFHDKIIARICEEPELETLTASTTMNQALVRQWALTTDKYEDYPAPDEAYRYDTRPGVPQDPNVQQALRKLGYEAYLNQRLPVFVYGTLRQGQGNSALIDPARLETRAARLDGVGVYHSSYGFPYAAEHDDPDARTIGEVVWLDDDDTGMNARYSLDYLEGFDSDHPTNSHYVREVRDVHYTNPDGTPATTRAWVYLAQANKRHLQESDRIVDGDWVQARQDWYGGPGRFSRF